MHKTDVVVIGAGPAGLAAAIEVARAGGQVTLIDENTKPGGQLFKQIHKFFGSKEHLAGVRGFEIGALNDWQQGRSRIENVCRIFRVIPVKRLALSEP